MALGRGIFEVLLGLDLLHKLLIYRSVEVVPIKAGWWHTEEKFALGEKKKREKRKGNRVIKSLRDGKT